MKGRWVVERTFSWLGNYRRLARNYEQYIRTAGHMAVIACSIFMLRYFRLNESDGINSMPSEHLCQNMPIFGHSI